MARSVTLKGNPLEVEGPELKVGDKIPDAVVKKSLAEDQRISDTSGKVRVFSVVPSLDTPVCATQTKRFFAEASKLPDGVAFYTVSCDLPTAQTRFCNSEGIDVERIVPLSDHKDVAFGKAFGTLIPALRVLSRAVFVVDKDDTLKHVEYVPEVASEPNYDDVLKTVKSLA